MTRLIHLAEFTPPHGGSFIPFAASVMSGAAKRGWTTEFVLPEEARGRVWIEELEESGAKISFRSGSRLGLSRWIGELLDQSDEPTLVHTHFTTYDVPAVLAARGRSNTSVYWHVHTVLSTSPGAITRNALKFATFGRLVDRILCPSSNIAEGVARRWGPSARISVFPSPIELGAFPKLGDEQRAEARRQWGVPDGSRCLLIFGRDWELKGGDLFLEAVKGLSDRGYDVHGLINTGGEPARRRITEEGLDDLVDEAGPAPDVLSLFGAADVFVAPSRGEGMPFSIIEAMCTGLPVVASDLPGHRFLADHLDGCTIADRDPDAIASAVASYLDLTREEADDQTDVAREWISENLDLGRATEGLLDSYAETLSNRRTGS